MPRALGYATASFTAGTEVTVNGTTYNEPSSATALSMKSASANDAAAGTGARTVKITYFTLASDGTIAGPFTQTVTLNGTTAVVVSTPAVLWLIASMEILTVGSGGIGAGNISLFPSVDGTGTAIAIIAAGDRRTYLGHAYVPTGKRLNVVDVEVNSGEVSTVQTQFNLRALAYPSANVAEKALTIALASQGFSGTRSLAPVGTPIAVVPGPARVRLYATPGNTAAATIRGEFGYYLS